MHVEVFALCDAATSHAGKLNLLGVFDTIYAQDIPVTHPACSIAIRLRWDRIEANQQHRIRLQFVDEDGRDVIPTWEGRIHVQSPHDRSSVASDLTLNLQQTAFNQYGQYALDLAINGRLEASLPLYVLPPPGLGSKG
jgi:hypothetical protein